MTKTWGYGPGPVKRDSAGGKSPSGADVWEPPRRVVLKLCLGVESVFAVRRLQTGAGATWDGRRSARSVDMEACPRTWAWEDVADKPVKGEAGVVWPGQTRGESAAAQPVLTHRDREESPAGEELNAGPLSPSPLCFLHRPLLC